MIDEYLKKYSETEREEHYQNKKEFITPLTYLLLRLAGHIHNIAKFELPNAYQKISKSMQETIGLDAQGEQNKLVKLMATISSGTGTIIQPLFQNCVMMIAAKMKLLPREKQVPFDANAPGYTYDNLLTVILTFADAPDLALGRVLPPILFELFRPLKTTKEYKKFLKFIVNIINAIPHSFNANQNLAEARLEKNTMLIQLLMNFVFYQMRQLKLSHETSIIKSIRHDKLRQTFLTAHLARLIYHREHKLLETLQHHFLSELDYTQEFVQSYQKPAEQDITDFFLTQPLPANITIGPMQFPITIADPLSGNLAITLEIPPEDPRHNSGKLRSYMSEKTKQMVDDSINTILKPKQNMPTNLIHLLFTRGNTLEIRNALTYIDSNRQNSIKNEALDVALARLFLPNSAEEKKLAAEIIQMMLEWGIISEWFAEANEGLGNKLTLRKMLIQKIYTDEPRLFGLLCDYLPKPKPSTAATSRATPSPQVEAPTPAPQKLITLVETELKKYESGHKKISINHMVTLLQKHGYTNENAIQQFISGYLTKQAIEEDQQPLSTSEEEPKKTDLIGSSYFLGKATIDSEQYFYPIRNISINSFLYFNPAEIQELQNVELFKAICEKSQIVGSYGSGLKRITGLSIRVNDTKFDICYELKVHGSIDRILCYMLPSDSKNDPVIYVACYYLQGGFHGRVNPADLKISAPYPGFCEEKSRIKRQNAEASNGFFGETSKNKGQPATEEKEITLKQLLSLYQLKTESEPPSLEKALRRAASQGNLAHIEQVLSEGAAINSQDDKKRKTALHWAVIKKHGAVIEYLCEQGADPTIKDSENKMALDYASEDIKKYFKAKDRNPSPAKRT